MYSDMAEGTSQLLVVPCVQRKESCSAKLLVYMNIHSYLPRKHIPVILHRFKYQDTRDTIRCHCILSSNTSQTPCSSIYSICPPLPLYLSGPSAFPEPNLTSTTGATPGPAVTVNVLLVSTMNLIFTARSVMFRGAHTAK